MTRMVKWLVVCLAGGLFVLSSNSTAVTSAQQADQVEDVVIGAIGKNGWTDDGTVVRLSNPADLVGIGTASPGAKVEVEEVPGDGLKIGNTTAWANTSHMSLTDEHGHLVLNTIPHIPYRTGVSGAYVRLADSVAASNSWDMGLLGDAYMIRRNAQTAFLTMLNNGNVGIGTTQPAERLIVKSAGTSWTDAHFALEAPFSTNKWDFNVGGQDYLYVGFNENTKYEFRTDGKLKVFGGVVFPDGTVQTTAGGGGGGIGGGGTSGAIPRFTAATTLGDSLMLQSGNTLYVYAPGGSSQLTIFGGPALPPPPSVGTINVLDGDVGPGYEGSIGAWNPGGNLRVGIGSDGLDEFGNYYDAGAIATCGTGVGGSLVCNGTSGFSSINTVSSFPVGYPDRGYVAVLNQNYPTVSAGMYVDEWGTGIVFGDVKNFRETNPDDPNTEIWYASVEGPEAAAYVRGTVQLTNGSATIKPPDHFRAIAAEDGMTVQLTPLSADSKGLAVVQKNLAEGIVVRELMNGNGTYDVDYLVMAVRKRFANNYRVIRPANEARPAISSGRGQPQAQPSTPVQP